MDKEEIFALLLIILEATKANKIAVEATYLHTKALEILVKEKLEVTDEEWNRFLKKAEIEYTIATVSDPIANLHIEALEKIADKYRQAKEDEGNEKGKDRSN